MIVTVTEKTTITNPFYLIHFESVATSKNAFFISSNISNSTDRFDEFVISPTDIETLDEGTYNYYIYAQLSDTNLDPSLSDELTESGLMTIQYTDYLNSKEYDTTENYKQYNG